MARKHLLLGWREWVALPELGIGSIRAKVDSGARSSCLHVRHQQVFASDDGATHVRFVLEHGVDEALSQELVARVVDRREVTDSGGHRENRVFISTLLRLPGGQAWPIEINLTERHNLAFPMLLGRSALRRRCLVDPARSWQLGTP
ncbi:MAG TPA: RimK/LysX family protein [Gemmatimonadaceae bacterium]|nr:RimK/LysX family protein [Gemmatimonadaceae bacterium]